MFNRPTESIIEVLTDETRSERDRHRARHYLRQRSPVSAQSSFVEVITRPHESTHLRFSLVRELPRLGSEMSSAVIKQLTAVATSSRESRLLRKEVCRTLRQVDSLPINIKGVLRDVTAELEQEVEFGRRVAAVTEFAINALYLGRDRFGEDDTPLFTDGLRVGTLEPVRWLYDDAEWIISNFANQQNFMRTLVGLTHLTDDEAYREAAKEATAYMFDEYQHVGGLLPWGGHRFLDLKTGDEISEFDNGSHELKAVFPFYRLLFEVNSSAATRLVQGMWEGHMQNWEEEFYHSRHGDWCEKPPTEVWDRSFNDPEPHRRIPRVGAMNHTSHDLIFAAAHAFEYGDEEEALTWGKRKAEMWHQARNSNTGLGSYYYHLEPTHYPDTEDSRGYEWPRFEEYGDAATSTRLWYSTGVPETVYTKSTLAKLRIAELLGPEGEGAPFYDWAHSSLVAFATSDAYNSPNNAINLLLTDGRVVERNATEASSRYFYAFAQGFRLTKDPQLWPVLRGVAKGHELGDIGEAPETTPELCFKTKSADPVLLFGLLELNRTANTDAYLRLATRIGDNILETRFYKGFFLPSEDHIHTKFNTAEPLALLALEAAWRDELDQIPIFLTESSIHGQYEGYGRTRDGEAIYSMTQ